MPITDDQAKDAVRQYAKKIFVDLKNVADLNSDDIKAAINDLVTFIESNAVAINNAIPEPAKSTATSAQKRYLLALAAIKLAGL